MPRKNIFKTKKLTLDYNGKYFVLLKNNNELGSNYDLRGAYNLLITIKKEIKKQKHQELYKLKEFNLTSNAKEQLEIYKEGKLESKTQPK